MIELFVKGVLFGFLIALPVGPVAVLCIQRTLIRGHLAGLVSGIGAAVADTIYGALAAFGLTVVSSFLIDHNMTLRLIGGLILIVLGARMILRKRNYKRIVVRDARLMKYFTSAFVITLTNPLTILGFAVFFTTFGVLQALDHGTTPWILVTGVFLGSFTWWLILSSFAHLLRHLVEQSHVRQLTIASGVIIIVFGIIALCSVFIPERDIDAKLTQVRTATTHPNSIALQPELPRPVVQVQPHQ